MGSPIPDLDRVEFSRRLRAAISSTAISEACIDRLYGHFQELRRWNPRLSLVGPGTAERVVERHFAESLEALSRIPRRAETLVDLGSGGGFPGLVLAAARPDLKIFLVEARERKWAFLEAASRRIALSTTCLNARVGPDLPAGIPPRIDVLTMRAVRWSDEVLAPLVARLSSAASVLLWVGEEAPATFPGLEVVASDPIAGSRHRRIVELKPEGARAH